MRTLAARLVCPAWLLAGGANADAPWLVNARLIEGRTGSIAVGLETDLSVVGRDPRADTTTLFEPMRVVRDGRVVLNRLE